MRNKNQRIDAVSGVHCSFSVSFTYYTPNESNPPPEGVRLGLGVDLTKTTVKGLQSPALTVGVSPERHRRGIELGGSGGGAERGQRGLLVGHQAGGDLRRRPEMSQSICVVLYKHGLLHATLHV